MTMGYTAPSKKAIKDAIKAYAEGSNDPGADVPAILDFRLNVQHTSFFHDPNVDNGEANIPGENVVVGPDAYNDRRWFATLTVDANGTVTAIR